jgi:hypothetical protein
MVCFIRIDPFDRLCMKSTRYVPYLHFILIWKCKFTFIKYRTSSSDLFIGKCVRININVNKTVSVFLAETPYSDRCVKETVM